MKNKKELLMLNNTEIEQKIINFYTIYGVTLEYIKKIDSFSITRYYYIIKNNARINKINNLLNELQLYIKVKKIKIDFEALNGFIIFECSKEKRNILYFEELKNDKKEGLTASIGKSLNNEEIQLNLLETPHLLVAGSTGSGKSCILNNIITSLVKKYDPNYFRTILIDIKQVEFNQYKNIKQLATPIITNTEKSIDILNKMCSIMSTRYNILSANNCRNIQEYNEKTAEKLCYYLIVIDELADLFIQAPDIEIILCRLAQLRACCWNPFNISNPTPRPSNNYRTLESQYSFQTCFDRFKCLRFKDHTRPNRSGTTNRKRRLYFKNVKRGNDKGTRCIDKKYKQIIGGVKNEKI